MPVPRRSRRRRRARALAVVLTLTAAVAFVAGLLVGRLTGRPQPPGAEASPEVAVAVEPPAPAEPPPAAPAPEPRAARPEPPAGTARIAIVIDDLGRDTRVVRRLAAWGVPVTAAVLPFEPRTADVVNELHRSGLEVLCHLPMEARDGADPGPGALTRAMGAAELRGATRRAVAAVPGAAGVNNHMGSGFSADAAAMRPVLEVLAERRLFYLDSRTAADSVGYGLAVELGIPAAERQVFLDADGTAEGVRGQFLRLLEHGRLRGAAVGIGHPAPMTLDVLEAEIPPARAAGYEFVPLSFLLDRPAVMPL